MASQKSKKQKKYWQKLFVFLNAYCPKTHLIKAFNCLNSPGSNGRLSQTLKIRGFREENLPQNNLKLCSAINFLKKDPTFKLAGNQLNT